MGPDEDLGRCVEHREHPAVGPEEPDSVGHGRFEDRVQVGRI